MFGFSYFDDSNSIPSWFNIKFNVIISEFYKVNSGANKLFGGFNLV